jgi:hypothetical protein
MSTRKGVKYDLIYAITAAINELTNFSMFKDSLQKHEVKIVVVDEGDEAVRRRNRKLLSGLEYKFYGPKEREEWFRQRFGTDYEGYLSVIPQRCHAETSFGFLVAWEENGDTIIELDDDVLPVTGYDLVAEHSSNLISNNGVSVACRNHWYNTLDSLSLEGASQSLFPRGHPYDPDTRLCEYIWTENGGDCVLNMGLWMGHPDLDALTILYHSGLNGRCSVKGTNLKRRKVVVRDRTYFALCSMNTAFKRIVIPAFYQLYMKHLGIDRFDDIWSGIFLKKIADHLNDKICVGIPLIYHDKRPRSIFKDLKAELEGMAINEILWRIVDSVDLNCGDYHSCYEELANSIQKRLGEFGEKVHRDFTAHQIEKMKLWLKVVDRIASNP